MTTSATAHNGTLNLSCIEYTTNNTLQAVILSVVDGICSQDSTDRGAWTRVVTKRIAIDTTYTEHEVSREIERMLNAGALYELVYEILDGILFMRYVRNGNEIL